MGKYTKTIGCKVESWVYDKIKNKYGSVNMYFRDLVYNDLNKGEKNSYKEVNHLVNDDKDADDTFSNEDKVDMIIKHKNKE
jgi:hypothetical protein